MFYFLLFLKNLLYLSKFTIVTKTLNKKWELFTNPGTEKPPFCGKLGVSGQAIYFTSIPIE